MKWKMPTEEEEEDTWDIMLIKQLQAYCCINLMNNFTSFIYVEFA